MVIFKTTEHLETLFAIWVEVNPQKNQYVQKQQFKQFIKTVFSSTNIRQTVKQDIDDKIINVWLKQYLSQMHNLQETSVKDVQFKYDETLDFLDWLVDISLQAVQNENQIKNQKEDQKLKENNSQLYQMNKSKEYENKIQQNGQQNHHENLNHNYKNNSFRQENDEENLQNTHLKQSKTNNQQLNHSKDLNQFENPSQSLKDQNKHGKRIKTKQDFNLKQLQTKYKEYLQIIFQHYCRLTYATGSDPTFQQIQHKTSIMTINKFMIFCKEFQIAQILPKNTSNSGSIKLNSRTYLIQIFKKHAECYKQMKFQNFCETIWKIAQVSFSQLKKLEDPKDIKQTQILSYEKVRILQYMQISFFKQFKQKMKKLNINYVLKTNTNNQNKQKKVPFNYKFKFQPSNHPTQKNNDGVASQEERKRIKSQRKQMLLQQRKNKNLYDLNGNHNSVQNRNKVNSKFQNFERSNSHTDNTNLSHNIFSEKRLVTRNSGQQLSNQNQRNDNLFVQKKLGPLLPPKKMSKNVNSSTPQIPNGITGYSKIHQAKKGLLANQQQQTPMSGSRKAIKNQKSYRLNSIVQEAKNLINHQQIYQRQKVNTSSSRDEISSSHPLSRQRYQNNVNLRNQNNGKSLRQDQQLNNIHNNMSNISEEKQELKDLIDLNDSDEDQFLELHLKKQKQKKNQIGRRIDKKISSLNNYQ